MKTTLCHRPTFDLIIPSHIILLAYVCRVVSFTNQNQMQKWPGHLDPWSQTHSNHIIKPSSQLYTVKSSHTVQKNQQQNHSGPSNDLRTDVLSKYQYMSVATCHQYGCNISWILTNDQPVQRHSYSLTRLGTREKNKKTGPWWWLENPWPVWKFKQQSEVNEGLIKGPIW